MRKTLQAEDKNVDRESLVDPNKMLLPPLHIKLGLMKQLKALPKEGNCFTYLCGQFPGLSEAKLKEGVFTGPEIRKLMRDANFEQQMNAREKAAWVSFKQVVIIFLETKKTSTTKRSLIQCWTIFRN